MVKLRGKVPTDTMLKKMANEVLELDRANKLASQQLTEARQKLLSALNEAERDGIETDIVKCTVVSPETEVIDDAGLMEALPEEVVDKITVRKLDKRALAAMIKIKVVDVNLAMKYTQTVASTPYVKITPK